MYGLDNYYKLNNYPLNLDCIDRTKASDRKDFQLAPLESRTWVKDGFYTFLYFRMQGFYANKQREGYKLLKRLETQRPFFTAIHSMPIIKYSYTHISSACLNVQKFTYKCLTGK